MTGAWKHVHTLNASHIIRAEILQISYIPCLCLRIAAYIDNLFRPHFYQRREESLIAAAAGRIEKGSIELHSLLRSLLAEKGASADTKSTFSMPLRRAFSFAISTAALFSSTAITLPAFPEAIRAIVPVPL